MGKEIALQIGKNKTSPPARGRRQSCPEETILMRFIPSCEGQTLCLACFIVCQSDSSPPASGRHSVFMRLPATLNTSLCKLHKVYFCLIIAYLICQKNAKQIPKKNNKCYASKIRNPYSSSMQSCFSLSELIMFCESKILTSLKIPVPYSTLLNLSK